MLLRERKFMQPARFRQEDILLVEINNAKVHESSREFGGGAQAPFPNSGWQSSLYLTELSSFPKVQENVVPFLGKFFFIAGNFRKLRLELTV